MRQIVSDTVQKSLAESGTVLSAIPAAQLNGLINALSDGMFAAISAVEGENETPWSHVRKCLTSLLTGCRSQHITDEKLLWRGRPYLTIGVIYELTSQRLRILHGILGNQIEKLN